MHNYYPYLYNQVVSEVIPQSCVFARSATAGCQQFPVHWGGDCDSKYESMAESLRGGLSLGLSGFGFWSHDIGGFEGLPDAGLYKRWLAFGLMSSHSRLHGSSSYRVPWLIDEESCDVLRHFTKLKCRLMPYLFDQALSARHKGLPLMRAMFLEFPHDPAVAYLDQQYMLGESLLVAPVFSPDGVVSFYLPSGTWTELLTGRTVEGPCWMRETHDVMSMPLWVRPNSVIAWGAVDNRPDYEFSKDVELKAYGLSPGQVIQGGVPTLKGDADLFYTASDDRIVTY
jgi:alpha-D-xyloside xylohydrolase